MLRSSVLFLVSFLAAAQNSARADFSVLHLGGIGPVRIGMSLSELNKALGTAYTSPKDPDDRACTYVGVPHQRGIALMILNGRVARIDVDSASTQTTEGIHNGDSEVRALQVYGKRLQVEPDYYDPKNSRYLSMLSVDRKLGVRFETTGGKITRYYAGTRAAISFIEGCS